MRVHETTPAPGTVGCTRGPRRRRALLAGLAVAGLLAAGCGDDDTDSSATDDTEEAMGSGDTDGQAYCEAALALETAGEPDIDPATATEAEMAGAAQAFAAETLRPLADDLLAAAPDEVREHLDVQSAALDEMAETGDFAVFETPEVQAAAQAAHAYDLDACGWGSVAVDAADYSFSGLPDELDAGTVSFELTNSGTEMHEMVLLRKNDGVAESFDELLALPEEQAMAKTTMVALAGPVPPGLPTYAVADLAAGDYMAVCFIPVGTASFDGPPPQGPPHLTQGMTHELTVT